jgi:hypothetical protein
MKMTLFAIAALAAALASSPTPAEAAPAAPAPAADQTRPSIRPAGADADADANGVGGPVEPVDFQISSILVEGRQAADESRWTGAVDLTLERRYTPRQPRYNQITIPF